VRSVGLGMEHMKEVLISISVLHALYLLASFFIGFCEAFFATDDDL